MKASPIAKRVKKTAVSLIPKPIRRRMQTKLSITRSTRSANFSKGDIFAAFGAFWYFPWHDKRIANLLFVYEMKLAILIYDLIPAQHVEWFGYDYSARWVSRFKRLLSEADYIFAISKSVASETTIFAKEQNVALRPQTILPIRLGDNAGALRSFHQLARKVPYVLVVGTLDVRKNQVALLSIWSRLIKELGRQNIPDLVFVGEPGLQSATFKGILNESIDLVGKVDVLANTRDADLAALYERALFTIFPTLAEGWGFPVAESLCFGKVCIASNIDSIREVGGDLVTYVNPFDGEEIYDAVKRYIINPDARRFLENRIKTEYTPTSWFVAANTILHTFGLELVEERAT